MILYCCIRDISTSMKDLTGGGSASSVCPSIIPSMLLKSWTTTPLLLKRILCRQRCRQKIVQRTWSYRLSKLSSTIGPGGKLNRVSRRSSKTRCSFPDHMSTPFLSSCQKNKQMRKGDLVYGFSALKVFKIIVIIIKGNHLVRPHFTGFVGQHLFAAGNLLWMV